MHPRFIAAQQRQRAVAVAAPVITSVTPNTCGTGDSSLTLTFAGTGFTSATAATMRDTTHGGSDQDLQSFAVNSDIEITCTYDAQIADAQVTYVTVTGPGGTSNQKTFTLT